MAETAFVPRTESEYQRLVSLLDLLIDRVGENETHPLVPMMDAIGGLIETYEVEQIPALEAEE